MENSPRKSGMLLKINQKFKGQENLTNVIETELNISTIQDNPFQPRINMDAENLQELMLSIEENGLIQPVPVARMVENGKERFVLIAGHRRTAAHKMLGKEKIKVNIFNDLSEKDLASMALVENLQRDDLKIIEVAMQYKTLINRGIFSTAKELAKSIGRDESSVGKVLKLLNLPDRVIEDIKTNKSTSDIVALDAIRRAGNEALSEELYFWFVNTSATRVELLNKIKSYTTSNRNLSTIDGAITSKIRLVNKISIEKLETDKKQQIEKLLNEILGIAI